MSEMLEKILSNDSINIAYKRVCANKGAGGVDEVTVRELDNYIKENWESIREQIRHRGYKPQPVRRIEILSQTGSERTRNPDRNGQGNSARHRAGDKSHV